MIDTCIRPATPGDLEAINAIYNYYVENSTCTYQTELESMEERLEWHRAHGPEHPIMVATCQGRVVGWGALSPFHRRSGYGRTVENSVYVDPAHHRQGIGKALLIDLVERAKALGHHSIVAVISADQPASIMLHEQQGFIRAGLLKQAGFKFGRWLDVVHLQKML